MQIFRFTRIELVHRFFSYDVGIGRSILFVQHVQILRFAKINIFPCCSSSGRGSFNAIVHCTEHIVACLQHPAPCSLQLVGMDRIVLNVTGGALLRITSPALLLGCNVATQKVRSVLFASHQMLHSPHGPGGPIPGDPLTLCGGGFLPKSLEVRGVDAVGLAHRRVMALGTGGRAGFFLGCCGGSCCIALVASFGSFTLFTVVVRG
mmetsp:Transcript_29093/g.84548  ORF Transcript_29093/g.84548 Transcript_29093/m.84548 type:complete len:206 (-) Transcript_29093:300-917(-)